MVCRGGQGIAVVMTPCANPIKEVSIQFARLVARSVVLEGARLRMRSFPGVISVKQDFLPKIPVIFGGSVNRISALYRSHPFLLLAIFALLTVMLACVTGQASAMQWISNDEN